MKNLMITCSGLNLARSIFSCLTAVKKLNVNLSWAKFSSLVVNIKDLEQPVKASFSQSEEVFYRSHLTMLVVAPILCLDFCC